jgi:hypothetical protein
MRPWFIMTSAAFLALMIVAASIRAPETWRPAIPVRGAAMQTTVEQPGGVRGGKQAGWSFNCVALFSAPKTMRVGDTAPVETDLLTTADHGKVDAVESAVRNAADAINNGHVSTASDALQGLDPQAADAIQKMTQVTRDRQAATDTLPGSPIITAHLSGPGFKITAGTPERQAVTSQTPAIWQWTVTAIDPGERDLTVAYSAEVLVADQRVPHSLTTPLSRIVAVSVTPTGVLKEVAEKTSSAKSIAENLSWFWTTMIFPTGVFVYGLRKWFRERRALVLSPR